MPTYDTSQQWSNYEAINYNKCPIISNERFRQNTGSQSTSHLPFSGGWYSDTDIDNPYGGIYTYLTYYDKTLNQEAYALNVVPNFQNVEWVTGVCNGTPQICTPDAMRYSMPYNLYPKLWTGYASGKTVSQPYPEGITLVPEGCAGKTICENDTGMILCTSDTQMSFDSCPGATGIYAFTNSPYIAKTDNYFLNSIDKYPRGVGTCIYPTNIISNDNDLVNLMALRSNNMIHPELADTLGLNYCYSPIQLGPGQGCGVDINNQLIQDCNVYYYDKNSPNYANSPCVQLVDRLIETDIGKRLLNEQNNQWCNNINHTYNPLCDCIKADVNDGPNGPIPARSAYKNISDLFIPGVQDTIPKKCWFTPCTTYAMPIYDTTPCPKTNITCNNIIRTEGESVVTNNNQYVKCINNPVPHGGNDIPTKTINFLVIFLILFVIGIVIFIVRRTKLKSPNNTS